MTPTGDKVQTLHPDADKSGPRIDRIQYDAFRRAILKAVPRRETGIPFKELSPAVAGLLPQRVRNSVGSITWYTTTIKLDLEARGEIERVPGSRPQRLRRKS